MNIIKNKILKNASWIILCKIVQSIVNLIIGMISARYLGPSNYGVISYAGSIVAFLLPLVQLGFQSTIVHEIVSNPKQEGKIIGTVLAVTSITSMVGILGIFGFVTIVNRNETDTIIVCLLYGVSLLFQMWEMIHYWYQAKLLSKYTSIVSLFAYVVVSLYKIYLLISGKNVCWFAAAQALDYLIVAVVLFLIYKKRGGQKLQVSLTVFKKMFKRSKYYILSSLMVMVYQHTDRIMLSIMLGEENNGYYSAAFTCACVASFVFSAIIDSARPAILESTKVNHVNFEKNVTRLFSILIYLGVAQSLFFTVAAKFCINILYGSAYFPAVTILKIITWYSTFANIGHARNIWILAENKQSVLWIINLSGAVLNIIGNYFLIPVLGAKGAAIASVVTYFFVDVMLCFIIKSVRPCFILMVTALNPKIIIDTIRRR